MLKRPWASPMRRCSTPSATILWREPHEPGRKIVYLADAISKTGVIPEWRNFASWPLRIWTAVLKAMLKHTITYLVKDECLLPDTTIQAYNQYCGL